MILVFILYALFASVFTIGKTALEFTQPFFLIGTRMIAAGCLILLYQAYAAREELRVKKCDFWRIGMLGLIAIYLTNICEFWGLKYLTSFKTCFLYSLSPFISAILCFFLLKEKLTKKKWLGLAIGFLGFLPILLSQNGSEELSGTLYFFSWAEFAVLIAVVSSVYGWILLSQLVKRGYSPLTVNGYSMVLGGVAALVHSALYETWEPFPIMEEKYLEFAECTLLLMLVSNFLAYNLYGYLLKRFSATFISFAGFTTPMFTVLFGWIFLGEVAGWIFYLSAAIVFVGLSFFHQEELRLEYQTSKLSR